MNAHDLVATPVAGRAGFAPSADRPDTLRPGLGLQVDLRTTPAGLVALEALPDHRVRVHAGAPVRGACQDHHFVYRRGDVDVIPAGQSDVWQEEGASTALMLRIAPALLRRAAEDMGRDPARTIVEPRHQFRDARIEHLAWALDAERAAGYPTGSLYVESLGLALAAYLLGGIPAPTMPAAGLSGAQLRRLTAYVEDHLDQDLSLARLAEVAGLSVSHLKASFRRATGLPVHEYVIRRRVERAQALLVRGELPASQVALEAGFAHQSHMARWMRRLLGVPPRTLVRGPSD